MFSTTTRFSDMKQKRNFSFLTSRSIAKTCYTIRSSGVLLQTGRVFLMTFIVVVKSYMEVSNETSDKYNQMCNFYRKQRIHNSNQLTSANTVFFCAPLLVQTLKLSPVLPRHIGCSTNVQQRLQLTRTTPHIGDGLSTTQPRLHVTNQIKCCMLCQPTIQWLWSLLDVVLFVDRWF